MKFQNIKSFNSSQRYYVGLENSGLLQKPLLKSQTKGLKNSSGRNHSGKITVRHKGGGHKRRFRKVDFSRRCETSGIVMGIEYDPNRKSNLASIFEHDKKIFFYIIAPKLLKTGDIVKSGSSLEARLGYSMPLGDMPVGSIIHCVAPKKSTYSKISRAAGTFSRLETLDDSSARLRLSSGEQRLISPSCYATLGRVSNEDALFTKKGKAGRTRWLNLRPSVRGVAMNPVDHPHGGGEGKKSGSGKTFWGKPIKGGFTSKSKNKLIIRQRNE